MRWLRFAVLILLAAVLQAGAVKAVAVTRFNICPDLLLILLAFFAVYGNTFDAIITSFAIGFAADLISPVMGPQTISFGLLGTLLAYLNRLIAIKKMPHQAAVIFTAGILAGALAYWLSVLRGQPHTSNPYTAALWTSAYSGLVGPFLFLPSAWWMGIKTHHFGKYGS